MKKWKKGLKRLISLLLITVIVLGVVPLESILSKAASTGGFEISLNWNDADNSEHFEYDSLKPESKIVRLNVKYANKDMKETYESGTVAITVPGIGKVKRDGIQRASSVAADPASSQLKEYTWSYTYDENADIYTFTNNHTLSPESHFAGSFEILWVVDSRDTVREYSTELQAVLRSKGGIEVQSNKVTYSQKRTKDDYGLTLYNSTRAFRGEGLDGSINPEDYWWVSYRAVSTLRWQSLGVYESHIEILMPLGAEIRFAEGGVNSLDMSNVSYQNTGRTETIGGTAYQVWTVDLEVHSETDNSTALEFVTIYPKNVFQNNENVQVYIRTMGTYYDLNTGSEELARTKIDTNLLEYPFPTYTGKILYADKQGSGVGRETDFARKHSLEAYLNGYIDSRHVRNGARDYTFYLTGEVVYPKLTEGEYDVYDLEITDEEMKIISSTAGYRILQGDEYNIKSISIPANAEILNQNNKPIEPCKVEIYVKSAINGSYSKMPGDYQVEQAGRSISLPDDTVGVRIVFCGLQESIRVRVPMYVNLHTEADDIVTDGGELINTVEAVFYAYRSADLAGDIPADPASLQTDLELETERQEQSLTAEETADEAEGIVQEIDVDTVQAPPGNVWESEPYIQPAKLYILERYNFFFNTTRLSEFGEYSVKQGGLPADLTMRTTFNYMEDEQLGVFHMYTILPENIKLSDEIRDADALFNVLTVQTTLAKSVSEVSRALTVKIEKNYQGSGRTKLSFVFDFTGAEIVEPNGSIAISFPIVAGDKDMFRFGVDTSLRGVSIVKDEGALVRPSYGIAPDDGSYAFVDEEALWADLDGDGDQKAELSHSLDRKTNESVAIAINEGITKLAATETEGNIFTIPGQEQRESGEFVYIDEEIPVAEVGSGYSYKLQMNPRADKNLSYATNIVFIDAIEAGEYAEWQGIFEAIDVREAEELLTIENERTIKAVVYYSARDFSDEMEQASFVPDFNGGDWSETKPAEVKTVAVSFGDARLLGDQQLTVTVHMRAPTGTEYAGKITENKTAVLYDAVDGSGTNPEYLPSNGVAVKLMPELTNVRIIKKDQADQSVLEGAMFDLYEYEEGSTPVPAADTKVRSGLKTNSKGEILIRNLPEGYYYLLEQEAPKGYFRIDDPILIEVTAGTNKEELQFTIENQRKPGTVTLEKRSDRGEDLTLKDALFDLYKKDGDSYILVETGLRTDNNGHIELDDLEWGDYYFAETAAPDGYRIADPDRKYEFTINSANNAGEELELIVVVNEQIPAAVRLIKYEKLEDGTTTNRPVANAFYVLYTKNGDELGTYMTDLEGIVYVNDLPYGSYYFKESIPAKGYYRYGDLPEDSSDEIWFNLEPGHTAELPHEEVTYNQRKYGNVILQKNDETGEEVNDAAYTLYKYNEVTDAYEVYKPDASYVNPALTGAELIEGEGGQPEPIGSGIIRFQNLIWGTYKIKETASPAGYQLNEDEYEVVIGPDTVEASYLLEVEDKRAEGSVKLIKVAEGNHSQFLEYAEFNLYKNDGTVVKAGLITDEQGEIYVDGLEWGSYYFEEITPPPGYSLTGEKIRFSVNRNSAGITQEILVENPQNMKQLYLTKSIKAADIVFSHGNPTFIFKVTDTKGKAWYRSVVFDEAYVKDYLTKHPGTDYVEITTSVTGLANDSYTASELEVVRYEFESIKDYSSNASVNITNKTVTFDLTGANDEGKATFVNKKHYHDHTSETVQVNNIVKKGRKMTAIRAEHDGTPVSGNKFDRSTLRVWAIYDDGTELEVSAGLYKLPQLDADDTLPDSWGAGDYTLIIEYTEGGATRSTSVSIYIERDPRFIWTVDENNGTAMITGYGGNAAAVVFPNEVKGIWQDGVYVNNNKTYIVTGISGNERAAGESVFNITQRSLVMRISFPQKLEVIGDYTFKDCNLIAGELKLPETLTYIGTSAFENCTAYTGSLYIPNKVETIGDKAFYGCTGFKDDLEIQAKAAIKKEMFPEDFTGSLIVGDEVAEVESGMFFHTNFTGDLYIGAGTMKSGKVTISKNDYPASFLGNLTIAGSVQVIGDYAFGDTYDNPYESTGTLTLGDKIEKIGEESFGSSHLSGPLVLPESLIEIGESAFWYAWHFEGDLIIPDSVTKIGAYAFSYTEKMTGKLKIGNSVTSIGRQAFFMTYFTGELVLPDSLTVLEQNVFQDAKGLTSLQLGAYVTKIEKNAFSGCTGLRGNLSIPNTVTEISDTAFSNCGFDGTLTIGNGLQILGYGAFQGCEAFTGTTQIPASLITMGKTNASIYNQFGNFGAVGGGKILFPTSWTGKEGMPYGAPNWDYY